jgi:uncharacterized repeat protein (TIGR01451 family)
MSIHSLTGLRAALVAVAALGWWTGANAQDTLAGTAITNRASVNYSVGGLPQAVIESSPTGNVTPGAGAGIDTSFLVDNRVDLTVTQITGSVVVTPGMTNQVLAFTVLNTGNSPQGYALTLTEEIGTTEFGNLDNADFGLANLVIRVDEDPSGGDGTGNGTFDGTELAATAIDVLNPNATITVFVVSPTVPLTLINGNFANVNLLAETAVPGTNGGTLEVESPGANTDGVEILFADSNGFDGMENDSGQFAVQTAGLTITKTQTVLDDPFGSPSPRAIPGATVEYVIEIENTSATTPADAVSISDPVPVNTTFLTAQPVAITGGVVGTCTGDALDADTDGCGITAGGALTVASTVIGNVGAGATVTVAFQVLID